MSPARKTNLVSITGCEKGDILVGAAKNATTK